MAAKAAQAADPRVTPRKIPLRWQKNLEGWIFIGPTILGILIFQFMPILVSLYASLTTWDGLNPPSSLE